MESIINYDIVIWGCCCNTKMNELNITHRWILKIIRNRLSDYSIPLNSYTLTIKYLSLGSIYNTRNENVSRNNIKYKTLTQQQRCTKY